MRDDVVRAVELPESPERGFDALRAEHAFGERAEFFFDLRVALRLRQVALVAARLADRRARRRAASRVTRVWCSTGSRS